MTLQQLKNNYPNTWRHFDNYFKREGWGADEASNLNQIGFMEWFSDFIRDYEIEDIQEFENKNNEK